MSSMLEDHHPSMPVDQPSPMLEDHYLKIVDIYCLSDQEIFAFLHFIVTL